MQVLKEHGVFIDSCPDTTSAVILLTHAHSDSYHALRHRVVYASETTARQLRRIQSSVPAVEPLFLVPGEWYSVQGGRVHRDVQGKNSWVVLATDHCPGSLGFWFPQLGVLYLGDTRLPASLLRTLERVVQGAEVRHLVGDGFAGSCGSSPAASGAAVTTWLQAWRHLQLRLVCPHSGTLQFLAQHVCGDWLAAPEVRPELQFLASELPSCSECPPVQLVATPRCRDPAAACSRYMANLPAKSYRAVVHPADVGELPLGTTVTVVPSALWFDVNRADPQLAYWHTETCTLRLFVGFHASPAETQKLRRLFPRSTFERAPGRPL